jgi:hypothetical protein
MEIRPGSPDNTRITEILVRATRIPHGMRRAWARIPFLNERPVWEVFCPCNTHSTHRQGMLPVVTITLLKTEICLRGVTGTDGPSSYWTALCERCNVVYWAALE